MDDTLIFSHIPKTAGRSMRIGVFEPHIPEARRHDPDGYWAALRSRAAFDLIAGHCSAYGIHRLYDIDEPRYFVMLRDPVDRAVSYYYFVRQSASTPSYAHPNLTDATELTLTEFYQKPVYQNLQTRYVAGMEWEYMGRGLDLNGWLGRSVLTRATSHLLNEYEAFGLKERFEESADLMASCLGVESSIPEKRHKSTSDRPAVAGLSEETRRSLRQSNSLDTALYEVARSHFENQTTASADG